MENRYKKAIASQAVREPLRPFLAPLYPYISKQKIACYRGADALKRKSPRQCPGLKLKLHSAIPWNKSEFTAIQPIDYIQDTDAQAEANNSQKRKPQGSNYKKCHVYTSRSKIHSNCPERQPLARERISLLICNSHSRRVFFSSASVHVPAYAFLR